MKVSYNWLNNFLDGKLPDAEAVAGALTFHAFEIDGIEKVAGDSVLDVKVTPNRGHDCLCHRGIAKELSAILKLPLTTKYDAFARKPDFSKTTDEVSVKLDTSLCNRYIAAYIKGVKVGPSPEWLKATLEAVGQRSINNVVDATNMVMFNIGQPLHAFDAAKLGSLAIGVRAAQQGEEIEALDKKQYTLDPSMLVITAGGKPVGIAGIKGGMPAAIDDSTTDIVIESANFDAVSVRKAAQALKLRTDASTHFEQGLSPELAAYGMQQAVDFILHMCSGELVGFVDVYPKPQQQAYVSVTTGKVNKLLGTALTAADIADVFARLGLPYREQDGVFEVQPPFERLDLTIAEDLVEEVGRLVGYDTVPATPLPAADRAPEINKNFYAAEKAREERAAKGYSEVLTSVFAERGERVVLNKVDGVRPYLRDSLIPGLADALAKNKPNKDLLGLKEIKLFEIGTVWKGGKEVMMLGTVSEKEKAIEMELVGPDLPAGPQAYDDLPLSQASRYQSFSKYPYIVRDIALWAGGEAAGPELVEGLVQTIRKTAGGLCQSVRLFDTFAKEGKISLAFRLIFQSFERTLTEAEANEAMQKVSEKLKAQGFEIR